jgi:uroporphyrinogen decarboxylase
MTKRDCVLEMAQTGRATSYVPAAFFLHFPETYRSGRAAVDKHVEYFTATGNDIMKIQYERRFERDDRIRRPSDWKNVTCYGMEFYEEQIAVMKGVVEEVGDQAVVVVTLYSAFMFAGHVVGKDAIVRHLNEDPEQVAAGLEIITDSMSTLIDGALAAGVDGFYASTQGGEAGRFDDPTLFDTYIRPLEMRIWNEIDRRARVNILHVCDYALPYESLEPFADYPGQIVSAPTNLAHRTMTGAEVATLFGRPFLGGMDRLGPLSTGPIDAVRAEAREALGSGPEAMILGADCTLAAEAPWENIAAATRAAHEFRRAP